MNKKENKLQTVQKYVLFFDICSSTSIIEDLFRSERLNLWHNLLMKLKDYLEEKRKIIGYEIYKFLGDGWILLFKTDIQGKKLFSFLNDLCIEYDNLFKDIRRVLSVSIDTIGLSFGLDEGSLIKIKLNSKIEYIGRALNVAARLQGAIKDKDKAPQGKVLMSNKVFKELRIGTKKIYKVNKVKRNLRNVSEGKDYRCTKLCLFIKP